MSTKRINKKVTEQEYLDGLAKMQGYEDSADKRANFKKKGIDKRLIPITDSNYRYHQKPKTH